MHLWKNGAKRRVEEDGELKQPQLKSSCMEEESLWEAGGVEIRLIEQTQNLKMHLMVFASKTV